MTDLDRLIAAVEAGTANDGIIGAVFSPNDIASWRINQLARNAFDGSLDAALRLHEALLPEWAWGRWSNGHMWVTDDVGDADRFVTSTGFHQDNPARALLLAILRAVKARGE
jgi:hypothetical protein